MATTVAAANTQVQPQQAVALQRLKIWGKLAKGDLHTITKQDVEELFQVLDQEERGEISREDMLVLRQIPGLSLTSEDVENLVNDADKDNSGRVSVEELFKALTQGELAYNMVLAALGQKKAAVKMTECDKEDLIEFLRTEYETKSSLWSLPQTLLFFFAFFLSSWGHLSVSTGYHMQSALKGEIEGEGPPYLRKYVHDVPTFWDWMESSFLTCLFKSGEDELEIWPYPGRVASYNQILGAVALTRESSTPATCRPHEKLNNFYDSRNGWCHKQEASTEITTSFLHYHKQRGELAKQMAELRKDPLTNRSWVDQNTSSVTASMLLYNGHLEAFTILHLAFILGGDGYVRIKISMETWLADPYNNFLWIFPDILFGVIILRMFYSEMLELVPAIMNGLNGFQQYMQFWNVVDWLSIIVGVAVMTMWGLIVTTVSTNLQDAIANLNFGVLDDAIYQNSTYLTRDKFESAVDVSVFNQGVADLHQLAGEVSNLHWWLRTVCFGYNFVLMMKFFKAFQANPRLNIVIKTIHTSCIDIIHFLIVFTVIFFVFSSAAYVFFGSRMKEFSTPLKSTAYCWRILMGEFDVAAMEVVHPLAANGWLIIFQFLVLQVLLNMLLAIIMDTYAAVNEPGAETIWRQIREALQTARETRGHLDMWYLICEFEDEDYQVHPDRVTSKSLRAAFESQKMTKHNSDYLIRKTAEFVKAKEGKSELKMSDAVRLIARMQNTGLRVQEAVDQMLDMMREERRRPQEERFDAIMAGQDPDAMPRLRQLAAAAGQPAVVVGAPTGNGLHNKAVYNPPGVPGPQMGNNTTNAPTQRSMGRNNNGWETESMTSTPPPSSVQYTNNQLNNSGRQQRQRFGNGDDDQPMVAFDFSTGSVADGHGNAGVVEEIRSLRAYLEQRDSWVERRLNALDRRCEKVERAADRMSNAMQGFDYRQLSESIDRVSHFLQMMHHGHGNGNGVLPPSSAHRKRINNNNEKRTSFYESDFGDDDSSSYHGRPNSARPVSARSASPGDRVTSAQVGGTSTGSSMFFRPPKTAGGQLDTLLEQVQQLLSHAEDSAEARKLLWKIDLNVRQTRTSVQKLEEQGLRPPADNSPTASRAALSDGFSRRNNTRTASGGSANRGLSSGPYRMPPLPDVPDHVHSDT